MMGDMQPKEQTLYLYMHCSYSLMLFQLVQPTFNHFVTQNLFKRQHCHRGIGTQNMILHILEIGFDFDHRIISHLEVHSLGTRPPLSQMSMCGIKNVQHAIHKS